MLTPMPRASPIALLYLRQMLPGPFIWVMRLTAPCRIFLPVGAECRGLMFFGCPELITLGLQPKQWLNEGSRKRMARPGMNLAEKNSSIEYGNGKINTRNAFLGSCAKSVPVAIGPVPVLPSILFAPVRFAPPFFRCSSKTLSTEAKGLSIGIHTCRLLSRMMKLLPRQSKVGSGLFATLFLALMNLSDFPPLALKQCWAMLLSQFTLQMNATPTL